MTITNYSLQNSKWLKYSETLFAAEDTRYTERKITRRNGKQNTKAKTGKR